MPIKRRLGKETDYFSTASPLANYNNTCKLYSSYIFTFNIYSNFSVTKRKYFLTTLSQVTKTI
jgi:hypothetical protein